MRASLTALAFTLLIIVALTAGCGLKGDLYLPDESPPSPPDSEQEQEQREDG